MGGTLEVKVKTFYQLTCIDKLMKMLLHTDPENTGSRFVMTSGEDDFEHILEAAVTIEGATDRIWQIMLVEKANKIKEFRETCGTISHSEDVLTIKRREITAGDSTFDDFVTVFKSFVEGMKPMEFEDIPVDDEFVDKIPTWQEEIENTLNKHCCTFIQEQKKVIAYFDSYEKAKQVEHLFLVKLGKRKQTARRRQVVATTKDGPESLQSEYVSSSVTKKADFEWSRDAKSCATFKTTEGIQVYVYKANILKLPVDCIVNAANDTLQHGGGVAQVIARGAGQELTDEGNRYIRKKHKIPVGQVVSTTAGKLPYSYVIHAVGPRWSDYAPHYDNDVQRCENDLFSALYNSFLEADKKGLQTIALPAISAAIFAVPIDLCVSQYVEAAIHYSLKESSRTNIKEIHFIDINPRIVRAIQSEFETVLVQAKVSPYDRQKHVQLPRGYRHRSPKTNNEASCQNFKFQNNGRRTHNQSVYEKKGADLMKDVSFSPGEVTMYSEGDKRVYLLGGTEEHRLFVYTSDIVKVKDSAIVVPLDEYRMVGEIGKAVNGAIDKNVQTNYRRAVEDLLPVGSATGTVAITKGFGSGFTRIIHIVFPYREREQDIMYRRKTLIAAFQNIFLEAMKEKDVKKVATTIFGIDDKKKEEVEFGANAFLEGYQHFLNVMRQSGNLKLEVHLVLRNGQYIERVRSTFDTFVQRQQEAQQNISAARGMKDSASEYHPEPMETGDENVEDCVICMDEMNKPRMLQCGHKFCVSCIERHFEIKKTCPTCGAVCGIITGDQPEGYMHWNYNSTHCAGYPNCGQISITYTFPTGRQGVS
ncbi:uncharacterized protein LOC128554364 [Mercenaria mercenaria]|uniref:uncharacterized protein LOC128554364 n=1 Tax=Mercenaria mercenaria TaxID=6596 RepID=UPI00234F6BCA|nr:uncharacterized protein LOC128554364 [Mercenaria mercenaria]